MKNKLSSVKGLIITGFVMIVVGVLAYSSFYTLAIALMFVGAVLASFAVLKVLFRKHT